MALTAISIVSLLLTLCYVTVVLFFRKGWHSIGLYKPENTAPATKISVLIAARNEEDKIHLTIADILAQNYPKHLTEIIIVDDHSTDQTARIIRSYASQGVKLLKLNEANPLNSYKKKAITEAIKISSGELIIATDADCRMGKNWLTTVVSFYQKKELKLISSPVAYFEEKNIFEQLQTLEFLYLIGLGASTIGNKMPSTCNGANLAYRRDVFFELKGFSGIDDLASGDDELFLHKVASRYPQGIGFCKSSDAMVYTHAKPNLREFIRQRKRWASKSTRYKNKGVVALGVSIWLFNVFILVNIFLGFYNTQYWAAAGLSLVLKFITELLFLIPVTNFVERKKLLLYLPLLTILHIFYFLYIGIAGNSGKYVWKGRLVRSSVLEFINLCQRHYTNTRGTWKKFKRNKLALLGMFFIILTAIAGILGYLIIPDNTPMANAMLLQLSIKKPGSQFLFLNFNKSPQTDTISFLSKMLHGQPALYRAMPVSSYQFKNDSVLVHEYIGNEETGPETAYAISSVIGPDKFSLLKNSSLQQLRAYVQKNNISKKTFYFGTDIYGRDILSRLVLGIRVSLSVGIIAVFISLTLGISLGAIAGYYGGRADALISWFMNVLWSLPALLLVIAISFALGKGFWQIFIAVGLSMWVEVARLVRGQVMALKNMEFVEAARAMGFKNSRIIVKHILPNIAGPVLVVASSNFASAILLEAGLSFLGFGAQPPVPTWGGMIKEHYGYIIMDAAYLAILPGLAIMLMVYAFNSVTFALRDAFDVKSQTTNV